MSLRRKYLRILSALLPAGAVGAALALTAAEPAAAEPAPATLQPGAANPDGVAARLAALRDAVSRIDGAGLSPADRQLAWWAWRNGGGGWRKGGGAWRNGGGAWRNAGGGWRNGGGGWGNGGWRNGPWSNFWRNF